MSDNFLAEVQKNRTKRLLQTQFKNVARSGPPFVVNLVSTISFVFLALFNVFRV